MRNFKTFWDIMHESAKTSKLDNWDSLVKGDSYLQAAVSLLHRLEGLGGEAVVWEEDYKNNKQETIDLCKEFLTK